MQQGQDRGGALHPILSICAKDLGWGANSSHTPRSHQKQGSGTSPWGTYAYLTNIYCRNVPHGCGVRLKVNVCTMCKSNSRPHATGLFCPAVSCRDVLLRWLRVLTRCPAGYAYGRHAAVPAVCPVGMCMPSRDGVAEPAPSSCRDDPRESATMSCHLR